jgi:hypothetical protein
VKEMVFTGRRWGTVTGHEVHKIMQAQLAQVLKNNRSEAGDKPD